MKDHSFDILLAGMTRSEFYALGEQIGYGYLLKNYNERFVKRCKDDIKVIFVDANKIILHIHCRSTGNEFKLHVNLVKETIEHRGCYQKNKRFDPSALIRFNINLVIERRVRKDRKKFKELGEFDF